MMEGLGYRVVLMPAKDIYHDVVCSALVKDGWTITDDPFTLKIGGRSIFIG
jgi:hypothetical protein